MGTPDQTQTDQTQTTQGQESTAAPKPDPPPVDVSALQRLVRKQEAELKTLQEAEQKRQQESMTELERERSARQKAEDLAKASGERANNALVRAALMTAAAAAGAVDASDVFHLADRSGLEVDETGNVAGAADVVAALKKSKPHLFTAAAPPSVGSGGGNTGTTPGGAQGADAFMGLKGKEFAAYAERVQRGEVKLR